MSFCDLKGHSRGVGRGSEKRTVEIDFVHPTIITFYVQKNNLDRVEIESVIRILEKQ